MSSSFSFLVSTDLACAALSDLSDCCCFNEAAICAHVRVGVRLVTGERLKRLLSHALCGPQLMRSRLSMWPSFLPFRHYIFVRLLTG